MVNASTLRLPEHFACRSTIAATDDEHARGVAVAENRHVGQHLVVDELVALGGLDDAVKREDPSEQPVLEDQQLLLTGRGAEQDPVHGQPLGQPRVQCLLEPFGHVTIPRRWSPIWTDSGLKAAVSTGIARCGSVSPHMNTSSAA